MMYEMFDAHCDTLYELLQDPTKGNLTKNTIHFSLENTKEYKKYIQIFALWANPDYKDQAAFEFIAHMLQKALGILQENKIKIILNKEDLEARDSFKALIGIEGGDAIYNDINNLIYFYNMGVRCLTLTWNGGNYIGEGSVSGKDLGLSPFGFEIIKKMNELGMAIDVSHLNEKGFYDVIANTNKPIIASHSNAKKICSHVRNLSDDQFLELKKNRGVVGINFYPLFLSDDGQADIDKVISHIEHFMALGGEEHIGIGSDFDGIPALPYDINSNKDSYRLLDKLTQYNYTPNQITNISFKNFHRVFSEILNI